MQKKWIAMWVLLSLATVVQAARPLEVPIKERWGDQDDVKALLDYQAGVRQALLERRFEDLEVEANLLRKSGEEFPNGDPILFHYYIGFGTMSSEEGDTLFEKLEKALHVWTSERPDSATAWQAFSQYAARRAEYESGFMFMPSEEMKARGKRNYPAWLQRFREHSAQAWKLNEERSLGDPHILFGAFIVNINGGIAGLPGREEVVQRMHGSQYPLHRRAVLWERSPWGSGTSLLFDQELKRQSATRGVGTYFEAAAWIARHQNKSVFDGRYKWDTGKIVEGYRKSVEKSRSLSMVGRMAYLSCLMEDVELARECLGRLDGAYEPDYFAAKSTKRIVAAPFLAFAGITEPRAFSAWARATSNGKDKKAVLAWDRRMASMATETARVFSEDLEDVNAFLDELEFLPREAFRKVENAIQCAAKMCASGTTPVSVATSIEKLQASPTLGQWVDGILQRVMADDVERPTLTTITSIYAIFAVGSACIIRAPGLLALQGRREQGDLMESLLVKGALEREEGPGAILIAVREGDKAVHHAFLKMIAKKSGWHPKLVERLDSALAHIESHGIQEHRLLAAKLRAR
jgi:hypothetical protein